MIFKNMSQNKIATLIILYASSVISWKSTKASHASAPFLIIFHSWLLLFTNISCLTFPQFYNLQLKTLCQNDLYPQLHKLSLQYLHYQHHHLIFFHIVSKFNVYGLMCLPIITIPMGWSEVEAGKRQSAVNWCDTSTPTFFLFLLQSESGNNRWKWSHHFKILAFLHFHFATGHYWCYRYETS